MQAILNDDILVDAIKYTQTAREKGQMIPNGEVYGLLAGRMGMEVVFEES